MALIETLKKHDQIDEALAEAKPDTVSSHQSLNASIAQAQIEKLSEQPENMPNTWKLTSRRR